MENYNKNQKDATEITKKIQKLTAERLGIDVNNVSNKELELAGLHSILATEDIIITNEEGESIWDLNEYGFLKSTEVPDTINPSLWLNAMSNYKAGLFWVVKDKIFQVRGLDIANITFVRTDHGFLVLDTGTYVESAKAALDLAEKGLGEDIRNHIKAIIISHSHGDHYGGVAGIVSADQVGKIEDGKIPIIVPEGFDEETVSENIYAGTAMNRRGRYQFGSGLKPGKKSLISCGLGLGMSSSKYGTPSYIAPTIEITENKTLVIDGLEVVFQLTPGTEAPAEMNNYFPQYRALWAAENCTATLHNFYPIRGAKVRDSSVWSDFTMQALEEFGPKTDVVFQSHHWPHWNTEENPNEVKEYLTNTAAIYKYIHDQTLLLANQGLKPNEIAHKIVIPKKLEDAWYIRPYYGSIEVNAKAVYQRYLGYYDANPVHLNPLTDVEASQKFIDYVGSEEEVLKKAKKDFDEGNYQWAAEAANHVVLANPDNTDARLLCADALEQMGYVAESSIWRNAYLTGAWELRNGVPVVGKKIGNSKFGMLNQTNTRRALGYLGIVIDGERAADENIKFIYEVTDTNEVFTIYLYVGTLLIYQGKSREKLPVVKAPKYLIGALIQKKLDDIKEQIETDIYQDLKRMESYVVDLREYTQFHIVDR
ncbi:MAG: alkyl sulfatase dimerization domain-containing protein [Lachnospiraceae bacterium]|nr:alkyl sulfatase dimerization domain-containing protein [Lachnospiraceae bacterium]